MKCILTISLLLILSFSAFAQKREAPSARLNFVIVKAFNDKPIHNAYIVLHPVNKKGNQGKTGLELKTDIDGKSYFDGFPYGKVRVQVIVDGYQTYGEDFDVNQPVQEFHIKMERPKAQFSIYDNNKDNNQAKPKETKPATTPDSKTPANPPPSTPPPAASTPATPSPTTPPPSTQPLAY